MGDQLPRLIVGTWSFSEFNGHVTVLAHIVKIRCGNRPSKDWLYLKLDPGWQSCEFGCELLATVRPHLRSMGVAGVNDCAIKGHVYMWTKHVTGNTICRPVAQNSRAQDPRLGTPIFFTHYTIDNYLYR